ncbi:hypothetical protein [Aquibacillus albus]|uniref:Uncharacterized protein n=1 Tax=Aquibacillus albus TaxID=1168171 RepID=A0ABS2MWE7_9BACI|nr:hypothetical protein [Aquibacillus albus]MBM7570216.1 hypothetical protein [Aquibacillus albus]
MHTTNVINSQDFTIMIDDKKSSLTDVFLGFNETDRIGIVVRCDGGGIGASTILLAAVTKFYDFYRSKLENNSERLRIYPDYFIFHVGNHHMNHAPLDIWPGHKEVVVEDNPEQILEAINDRGITRLIVEDINPTPATFLRETVSSAQNRIVSVLAYSTTGRVNQADVTIKASSKIEKFVVDSLKRSENVSNQEREELINKRKFLHSKDYIVETFRRIEQSDALLKLASSPPDLKVTSNYVVQLP